MNYYLKNGIYYADLGGGVPENAIPVTKPASPLVLLVRREPQCSRGFWAVDSLKQIEEEGIETILPSAELSEDVSDLEKFVRENGASVLNTEFSECFEFAEKWILNQKKKFKINLVGLGDVGGTVLTGLKLLGREISEISVYDYNYMSSQRYVLELNQVLPLEEGAVMPTVTICKEEDLFNCDLLLFTASKGVPPVGSQIQDVRMAQYEENLEIIRFYARRAREAKFKGLFCQISDPVDLLAKAVFLESNLNEGGIYDWEGLLPEQVQGFGLGVMAARAKYYAPTLGLEAENVQVYGPHGQGLVVANDTRDFDQTISEKLTTLTIEANQQVRKLGYKPYIAPGLSSATISILKMLRGEFHYGAIPLGRMYFGCRSRFTRKGIQTFRETLNINLLGKIQKAYEDLCQAD